MKVALALTTKDRPELTEATWTALRETKYGGICDLFWFDGSKTDEGKAEFESHSYQAHVAETGIVGGADRAIVYALTRMLDHPENYSHVGLIENDVLPTSPNWLKRTMELFIAGNNDGLAVGAVSARTYADRILVQRPDYALLHNAGAGQIIFTRFAAELVLEHYRTGWWSDNRAVFSKLSGLDIGKWACFRTNLQPLTADWHYDTVLAAHGYATLGLTPSPIDMIGQVPPLEEQGLELVREPLALGLDKEFLAFRNNTFNIRAGYQQPMIWPWLLQRNELGASAFVYFPHQFTNLDARFEGEFGTQWSQGYGPFSYRPINEPAIITIPLFGAGTFLISGGDHGAQVAVIDTKSGFEARPTLPPEGNSSTTLMVGVPGDMQYRDVRVELGVGSRLYSLQTAHEQPWNRITKFDFNSLPQVYG